MAPKRKPESVLDPDSSNSSKRSRTQSEKNPENSTFSNSKKAAGGGIPTGLSPEAQEEYAAAFQEANSARSQIEELTANNERIARELQSLQSKLQGGASPGTLYIQDRTTILAAFRSLKKKMHDWAANNAPSGHLQAYLSAEDVDMTILMLQGKVPLFPYQALCTSKKAQLFPRLIGGPRAGLQTIIEHLVAYEILSRPLHFLRSQNTSEPGATEQAFLAVYALMKARSEEGKVWIGQTVQSMYKPEQYRGSLFKHITADPFEDCRKAYYEELIDKCLYGDSALLKLLLKSQDEESLQKQSTILRGIFMAAGKLSLQLCAQNIIIMVHGLKQVGSDSSFQPGPDNLELHTIVKSAALDIALVRKNIGLVVSPQVVYLRCNMTGHREKATTALKGQVVPFVEEKLFSGSQKAATSSSNPRGLAINRLPVCTISPQLQAPDLPLIEQLVAAVAQFTKAEIQTTTSDATQQQGQRVSGAFQPASIDYTVAGSQLLEPCKPGQLGDAFQLPEASDHVDVEDDDALARWKAKRPEVKFEARGINRSPQKQQFDLSEVPDHPELPELPETPSILLEVTGPRFAAGFSDDETKHQEPETTKGSADFKSNEAQDKKQPRFPHFERARWSHDTRFGTDATKEKLQEGKFPEKRAERMIASTEPGLQAPGPAKGMVAMSEKPAAYLPEKRAAANIASQPAEAPEFASAASENTEDNSAKQAAALAIINVQLAVDQAKSHEPLAPFEKSDHRPETEELAAEITKTPRAFDTMQETLDVNGIVETMSLGELKPSHADAMTSFDQLKEDYIEDMSVLDWEYDSGLLDQIIEDSLADAREQHY